MDVKEKYYTWEEKLWEEYFKIFNKVRYTIKDGVISPSDYYKSDIKIMFLNREPYDQDFECYHLTKVLKRQIEEGEPIFKYQRTMRSHMRDNMAMVTLLKRNLMTLTDEDVQREHDRWNNEMFEECMYRCAYVNIKKSDGLNSSSNTNLREYAEKGIGILKKQIEYFNPTIILGGNVIYNILDGDYTLDWGKNLYIKTGVINVFEININGKFYPIFDLFHPSATSYSGGSMSDYFWEVFNALKNIEEENPGYWASRMGQKCFNDNLL